MSDQEESRSGKEEKPSNILIDRLAEMACTQCGCELDVSDLDPFSRVECPDCTSIEIVPARLGPFLLLDLIGAGGMGGVYYAKDEALGRFVAIKVMLKSLGDNREFVQTFLREAQAIAKMNHPNICQIYSLGQEKGQPYIVMELVSGDRFDKMIEGGNQVDQSLAMQVGADIAEGLNAAAELGLLHGDVKPENILLDKKGQAKLVDFGLATFAQQGAPEGIWGTPYYIAPEKVKRQKADIGSDIYSLGATLYHALAGRPPFEGPNPIEVVKARLTKPPAPLHQFRKDINPLVEKIIMRMMEIEPSRRYPTYTSAISDLKRAVEALPAPKARGQTIVVKSGGKTIIKKKSSASTVEPRVDVQTPAPSSEIAPRPGKIVIAKKKSKQPSAVTPRTVTEGDRKSNVILRTDRASDKKGKSSDKKTTPTPPPKKSKKGLVIFIIFLVVALGVGAGVIIKVQSDAKKARMLEAASLANQRKIADTYAPQVVEIAAKMQPLVRHVEPVFAKATNAVFVALGEFMGRTPPASPEAAPARDKPDAIGADPADVPAAKPAPRKSPATAGQDKPDVLGPDPADAPPAAKPVPKTTAKTSRRPSLLSPEALGLPAGGTAAPATPAAPQGPVVDEMGREAPAGIDLPPRPAPKSAAKPAPEPVAPPVAAPVDPTSRKAVDPTAAPPAAEPPPKADAPPAAPAEPEVKVLARAAIVEANKILEAVETAKQLSQTVTAARTAAQSAFTSVQAAVYATQITNAFETITQLDATAREGLVKARKSAEDADVIAQRVARERDEARKAQEAELKRQQEEQARLKAEAELKARTEVELKMVIDAKAGCVGYIQANKFKDALNTVTPLLAECRTEPGKKAMQALVDRYKYLVAFKEFLIERLNADPFKWGFYTPSGREDVLSADDKVVKIRSRTVAWEDISTAQMMEFIKRYLAPEAKRLPIKQQGEMLLAAAIFCDERGGTQATPLVKDYAQRAVDIFNSLEGDRKRILGD